MGGAESLVVRGSRIIFFFQAEDGIRDKLVTGVQTCALPILVALDVAGGRLDTVATAVEQAALGPDGTLYAVDDKRRVVTVARRVRLARPPPPLGVPRGLVGARQRPVAVLAPGPPQMIAAAPHPPP